MFDPFSASLGALFRGPGAVDARFTPAGGEPLADSIRVIRSRPDEQVRFGEGVIVQGTNAFEIQRGDVDEPRDGDLLTIAGVSFRLIGDAMLDAEGLTWKIGAAEV
ncbi:hypothetical protein [Sphingomonas sp. BK580]|uniref:head-tail joining protein n=1 Tax=Sphingomonas sp. BK580 TaxID=2586972 RepID=UPI00161201D4|nr:hypothetical protein [Sphingomonas sp. BK580]MBB3691457.1 hypothetical protein [Sphingomonas sp. BK580]